MTGRQIGFHPEAVAEARAAREWYAEQSPAAANSFLRELDLAVGAIRENPQAWPPYDRTTRRYIMRRFPFQVVYRVVGEVIQVLAVAHGRRRPGYWRRR